MFVARYDRRTQIGRRSGRERRITLNPKHMFVPERRTDLDRRSGADRRICERRSGLDRRKIWIEHRLIVNLGRLEYNLERRSGIDRRRGYHLSSGPDV